MPGLPKADEAHVVPSGYWKIVAVGDGDSAKVAAFVFDQDTARGADMCGHLVTVREVERRADFDFFHELGTPGQDLLEDAAPTLSGGLGCPP